MAGWSIVATLYILINKTKTDIFFLLINLDRNFISIFQTVLTPRIKVRHRLRIIHTDTYILLARRHILYDRS